jgi:hypothetical protein
MFLQTTEVVCVRVEHAMFFLRKLMLEEYFEVKGNVIVARKNSVMSLEAHGANG